MTHTTKYKFKQIRKEEVTFDHTRPKVGDGGISKKIILEMNIDV